MATTPHQLFLLADHVKLTLLERNRAKTLNLQSNKQDAHIARTLDTIRDGLAALDKQRAEEEAAGQECVLPRTVCSQ